MRIGLIAEFNPLHSGHIFLIQKARELIKKNQSGEIICVMSELFTQRGEVAIINGHKRAEVAVQCGLDAVFALPYRASVNFSDDFAKKSIDILVKCEITHLIFGTEYDIDIFEKIYQKEMTTDLKKEITQAIKLGYSYPKIMSEIFEIDFAAPNFILAYSYFKALKQLAPHIKLLPIKRQGQNLNEENLTPSPFLSATAIRKNLQNKIIENYLSKEMLVHIQNSKTLNEDDFYHLLKYSIIKLGKSGIKQIYDVSEGLENRIYEANQTTNDYKTLVDNISTKRYSRKKIQRILLHILTNTTKIEIGKDINHIRCLAIRKNKTHLIKQINNNHFDIHIHSKLNKANSKYFEDDIKISRIYNLLSNEVDIFKTHIKLI